MNTIWDTMPAEWQRYATLQAKRGPLTDAEWEEFLRLDALLSQVERGYYGA